jgi:hypothetical protein
MMGADDRSKSVIFDPRSKQYVYADTGERASQADINASGSGYGSRISQTPMFSPGMNNYGTASDPYGTTAGTGGNVPGGITNDMLRGGSVFRQISNARPGQEISRAQAFGLTEEAQARGGAKLQAEQNTLLRAQAETQNKQLEQQANNLFNLVETSSSEEATTSSSDESGQHAQVTGTGIDLIDHQLRAQIKEDISKRISELNKQWDDLQEITKLKGEKLFDANCGILFEQSVDSIDIWIKEMERNIQYTTQRTLSDAGDAKTSVEASDLTTTNLLLD